MANKLFKSLLKRPKETTEQRVARTILKDPQIAIINGRIFNVKPPTLSAIIRVSAIVSAFPQSETRLSKEPEEVLKHVLLNAYQYENAGAILATLILGWYKNPTPEFLEEHEALATLIEDNLEPRQYDDLLAQLLNVQQVSDFFALTATLSELNLIEGKREETIIGNPHTD